MPTPAEPLWLSDRHLAEIGRRTGARLVVYPKILTFDSTADLVLVRETPAAATVAVLPGVLRTEPVLYARIIDVSDPGNIKTIYMRQEGYPWGSPAPGQIYYADRPAIPLGVGHLFRYFEPLDRGLTARGMPSLRTDPDAVVARAWPDERVAGFREEFRENER